MHYIKRMEIQHAYSRRSIDTMKILGCLFGIIVLFTSNYMQVECRTTSDFFYDIYRINATHEIPRSFLNTLFFNMSNH